jgi:TonB family protein
MKKVLLFLLQMLPVAVFAQVTESTSVLHDVAFERRIDMLNLEGESYDSVLVKFNVGDVFEETVKVDVWDKRGTHIYGHTFRKMNCFRATKDFDDNVIIVGKPSMFFLMIKKCDDGPKLCVIREREGITKSPEEYIFEYFRKLKQSPEPSSVETGKVYDVVERMPQFPGGPSAMFEFLTNNINYPVEAEKKGIQGRVIVTFVVERDGTVTNAQISTSAEESLDNEALRIVREMPKWIPGKQDGHTVRVKYTVPVTFRLK